MAALQTGWKDDGDVVLQYLIEGYFDMYGSGVTAFNAVERVRAFFGMGLALAAFEEGSENRLANVFGPPSQKLLIHRITADGSLVHDASFSAAPEVSAVTERISVIDVVDPTVLKWIVEEQIFGALKDDGRNDQVRRAAAWHFDSYASANELLSFVQAMTVVEILLGEQEADGSLGLTKLLANRCAYFLGETPEERKSLLNNFQDIYRIRSKIVHTGKSRLSENDRTMLHGLRRICRR